MIKIILGIVAFVLLINQFSTFLILLISIIGIDPSTLNEGALTQGVIELHMTEKDLGLLWVFLCSVAAAGFALILVFVDMALFHSKYVKTGLILTGIHFALMLSWIVLGATVYVQQHSYFAVLIHHLQPQLLSGSVASCLAFIVLWLRRR